MARLRRLETSLQQISEILVLQNQRVDLGFANVRDEVQAVREETRLMRETLSDRLDRLIAITIKERTAGIERLASIEQRLARLEERVGI